MPVNGSRSPRKYANKKGKLTCAPGNEKNVEYTGTCYSRDQLVQISKEIGITVPQHLSAKQLGKVITDYMRRNPSSHTQNVLSKFRETVRPKKPSTWKDDPYTWINTMDLLAVMRQYEKAYPNFKFVGVFPRDFAVLKNSRGKCIVGNMCNFDAVQALQNGKYSRLGFVINLDKYGNPGTHWVTVLVDTQRNGIYYFDSTADPPPKDILVFMQNTRNQLHHSQKRTMDMEYNRTVRQSENTECGIFCLTFLVLMLETSMTFHEVCKFIPKDADVHMLRDVFFNH